VALLGGGTTALEQPAGERQAEAAGRVACDDGGLVEAALEVARAVQRQRDHEVGRGRNERAPLARDQHAEQPPAGGLAVELERAHAMVDRVVVAIGRDEQRPGGGPRSLGRPVARVPRGLRREGRQLEVADGAQVERAPGRIEPPAGTAQRAGGWQAGALDPDQVAGDCRPQ